MLLALLRRQPFLMIISQQLVQKVDRLVGNVSLILGRDEARPRLARVPAEHIVELRVELDFVSFQAVHQPNSDQRYIAQHGGVLGGEEMQDRTLTMQRARRYRALL